MPRPIESRYPPERYDYIPGVAVFKTHQRVKNGKVIKVTKDDLEEIAANHNWQWEVLGRASPFSKGHTLDEAGKEVPESDQPDVCGAGLKFHVGQWPGEEDEHYIFCTWAVPKEEKDEVLKNFVSISPEYYPGRKQLYPISLLKSSAPELEMPPIPLRYGAEDDRYRISLPLPFRYSQEKEPMNPMDEKKPDDKDAKKADDKPEDAAMKKASKEAEKGAVEDKGDLAEIKQMLAALQPLIDAAPKLMQLVSLMDEEGEGDLMAPADEGKPAPGMGPEGMEKGAGKPPPEKDSAKSFDTPVKFDSAPSSTNCFVPGTDKEKGKYTMKTDEDALKYKAEVEKYKAEVEKLKADQVATQKVAKDLYKESRLAKAKQWVADLETVDKIQYASDKERSEDIKMLAELEESVALKLIPMWRVRYQKRLPNSDAVKDVAKYAVDGETDLSAKTPEEAQERALKAVSMGLTMQEYYKQLAQGKK